MRINEINLYKKDQDNVGGDKIRFLSDCSEVALKARKVGMYDCDFLRSKQSLKNAKIRKSRMKNKIVTERDLSILSLCFEQYFLTKEQVSFWLFNFKEVHNLNTVKIARWRLIEFLLRQDFLEERKLKILNDSELFNVTEKGVRKLKDHGLAPDFARFLPLSEDKLYHDYLATNIRFVWDSVTKIKNWTTDRCLRETQNKSVPDAEFEFYSSIAGRDTKVAVEIELSQKSRGRYERKFFQYQESKYDLVIYFVKNEHLKELILDCSARLSGKIFVAVIDDVLSLKGKAMIVSNSEKIIIGEGFDE